MAADNISYFAVNATQNSRHCIITCLIHDMCNGVTFLHNNSVCKMASCVNPHNMGVSNSAVSEETYLVDKPTVNTLLARGKTILTIL